MRASSEGRCDNLLPQKVGCCLTFRISHVIDSFVRKICVGLYGYRYSSLFVILLMGGEVGRTMKGPHVRA
jgi:hypothetical protein